MILAQTDLFTTADAIRLGIVSLGALIGVRCRAIGILPACSLHGLK